ncbi:hypothetical protein MRX96_035212 [Rhipicephalus microplus]
MSTTGPADRCCFLRECVAAVYTAATRIVVCDYTAAILHVLFARAAGKISRSAQQTPLKYRRRHLDKACYLAAVADSPSPATQARSRLSLRCMTAERRNGARCLPCYFAQSGLLMEPANGPVPRWRHGAPMAPVLPGKNFAESCSKPCPLL